MVVDPESSLHLNHVEHPGEGPYCLLVHGALGSRSYWMDNIAALATVCRPVVVELWGHGSSPSPSDPARYEPASYLAEFEHLRNELGVDRWFTVGQSMGAALTMYYGLAHPQRVIAQVITNCNSGFTDPHLWQERNRTMVTKMADRVEAEGVETLRDSWVNPGRSRRIAEHVREQLQAEFSEHSPAGIAQSFRVTNYALPLGDQVENITVRTLLTHGIEEEGFLDKLDQVQRIPDVEIVELPASHAVNAHDPKGWDAAVIDFFQRARSAELG